VRRVFAVSGAGHLYWPLVMSADIRRTGAWDVVGVGANAVDLVNVVKAFPHPAGPSKVRVCRRTVCCGGQTTTALATCTAFGLRAKYVGAVGSDEPGRRILSELARRGIDCADTVVRDASNQFAVILLEEGSGERVIVWDRDPRLRLFDADLPLEVIRSARLLHVDDVDEPAAIAAARIARAAGRVVTSDIDHLSDRTAELIAAVDVPIFDERLPLELTGATDAEAALRRLRKSHPGLLCMTLGARGAMALDGDNVIWAPGFPVRAVDTTGAGDVFRGGFIYAWLQGWPVLERLRFANAAAAISCTRLGAMDGIPTLDEVRRMLGREGPGS
jgi:sulfofructose kinase